MTMMVTTTMIVIILFAHSQTWKSRTKRDDQGIVTPKEQGSINHRISREETFLYHKEQTRYILVDCVTSRKTWSYLEKLDCFWVGVFFFLNAIIQGKELFHEKAESNLHSYISCWNFTFFEEERQNILSLVDCCKWLNIALSSVTSKWWKFQTSRTMRSGWKLIAKFQMDSQTGIVC